MTAIMAYRNGKQILLGADGTSLYDNAFKFHHGVENTIAMKITQIKDSPTCYIALTGAVKGIDYIRGQSNLLNGRKDPDFKFIVNVFIPRLFELEEQAGLLTVKDGKKTLDCSGVLITPTRIFNFYSGGLVQQVDDVVARGSGDSSLLTAYLYYKDKIGGLDLVRKCFSDTIRYHGDIGCPVYIVDNKGKEYIYKTEEELNKGL